jgi:hypothetical protein
MRLTVFAASGLSGNLRLSTGWGFASVGESVYSTGDLMTLPSRLPSRLPTAALLALATTTALLLGGCAATPDPQPTETEHFSGGGGAGDPAESTEEAPVASGGESSALDRATADGLPPLGLVGCPTEELYEYSPEESRSFWKLVYTCTTPEAFDASTASLVGLGYVIDSRELGDGDYVSDRNYFQADANGGSTEVQLNLTGWPDELEYEIYVTITLP